MSGLVYSGARAEGTLLRLVPDNHTNIIAGSGGGGTARLAPKNGVSVIQLQQQQQQQPADAQQQQMPPYDPARLKKHGKNGQPPPIAVAKRNARERNRVKQVNNGYATLRQHIPSYVAQGYGDRGKKLSKVETLRMALEYIRILQRLVAEADGLEYDAARASGQLNDSPVMIPSPSGSAYSAGTHNGSGDLLNLNGSEIDEQHDSLGPDGESYELEEEDDDDRHFRDDNTLRLSEKQNRELVCVNPTRRRRLSPTYFAKQSSFGDEENIEPLSHRNNNNNSNSNNNNLLGSYGPLVLQSTGSLIKRELEEERTDEEAYSGQMLIESPETTRLVGLKLEEHAETAAQLVYVAAASAEGLPAAYYKHELAEPASAEFMDVVSWWEQEQARLQPQHRSLAHV